MDRLKNFFKGLSKGFLYWWLIFTLEMVAFTGVWALGGFELLFTNDVTHLSFLILGLFGISSLWVGYNAYHNRPTNYFKEDYLASSFMILGLIGTIIGFILLLSGSLGATIIVKSALPILIKKLSEGLGVALFTTLTGSICSLFLNAQLRLPNRD